jgi:hypothetical protein
MIIPLYNLQAHNVSLTPAQMLKWQGSRNAASRFCVSPASSRRGIRVQHRNDRIGRPDFSFQQSNEHRRAPRTQLHSAPQAPMACIPPGVPSHFAGIDRPIPRNLTTAEPKANSWFGPWSSSQQAELPSSVPITSHSPSAVLGIHSSCSSPKYPPRGRPHSCTRVVHKMDQKHGLLGNVIGHMDHLGLSDERRQSRTPREEGAVEVRFCLESGWEGEGAARRQPGQPVDRPRKRRSASSLNPSGMPDGAEKRLSTASRHSVSTGSEVGSAAGGTRGPSG